MDYRYFFLIWSLIFLFIWAVVFFLRKDLRTQILYASIFGAIAGFVSECVYIRDWWQPVTITGTRVGPEDVIIGFAIAGLASVLYEELLGKRLVCNHGPKKAHLFVLALFTAVFLGSFFLLHVSSFYATLIAFGIGIIWLVLWRRDLIGNCFVSGLCMLLLGAGLYFLLTIPYPGFIEKYWYLGPSWYAHRIIGIPIAEYIWFFLVGAFIGPLYEFIWCQKLVPLRRKRK